MKPRDAFASGLDYDRYLGHVTDLRPLYDEILRGYHPRTRASEAFRSAASVGVRALVVADPPCRDCALALPILHQLATVSGLPVRIQLKADVPELHAVLARPGDRPRVPTVAFYDEHWTEVGRFIERVPSITVWLDPEVAKLPPRGSPEFRPALVAFRAAWEDVIRQERYWVETADALAAEASRIVPSGSPL